MRIFVTGATGFLGSYVTAALVEAGHEVAVLWQPGTSPWRISALQGRLTVIAGSFDDIDPLRDPLVAFRPEALVHMGWRGVAGADRDDPVQALNIKDAADLVRLAADAGACVFVGAGSQAEYGPQHAAIHESTPTRPTTLYGKSKLAACKLTKQIARERGMRWAWLRIFSTYGPKDADHWLIPSLIRTLREGRRMPLTACAQRWGFLHARDVASAFAAVVTDPNGRGVYNLGATDAPVLRDTVERLRALVDPQAELGFGEVPYRGDQVMLLQARTERLAALGWTARVGLAEGLGETVDWYGASRDVGH
jgi:nucleoside-diphosphate-sugar epimerase